METNSPKTTRAKRVAESAGTEAAERVDLRIAAQDKVLIESAAAMLGETISGFMKSVAMREARVVIEGAATTRLSLRDQHQFVDLLLQDREPSPALIEAAHRYKQRIISK